MNLTGTSILGWTHGNSSGGTFAALAAQTGDELTPAFHPATADDIARAAQLAADAFEIFRKCTGQERGAFLRRIAALLEENTAAIVERATLETALPPPRLQGEMARTCGQLRLFAGLVENGSWVDARIDHADPARRPAPKPDVRSMLTALGPVAVFGASNFPLAFSVAGGDTASAFAAGCPVIVKAHEGHPGTSEMVGLLIQQAARESGAPEGVFALLQGAGHEVGAALVRHPLIRAVGFTGSRGGGQALMDIAAARPAPIPFYAEMGSVNPVVLLPDALDTRAEEIAVGLHTSVTLGVGQFCTNPGLVFFQASESADRFCAKLTALVAATPPGTMLTARIRDGYRHELTRFASASGVKLLASADADASRAGAALLATDARTFLREPALLAEIFGPATLLVRCASTDELLAAVESLDGQLTATVHADDGDLVNNGRLIPLLERKAGRLIWNGYPTGVEVCPAMHHGGPYPATGDGRSTSVGTRAIERFARPVCYQDFPAAALPPELRDENPLALRRLIDGQSVC